MHISSHLTAKDLEGTTWNPTPRHRTTWCMVVVMPLEQERRQEKADGCQEPESRTCWPWSPNDSRRMSYPQNQKDLRPKTEGDSTAASKGRESQYPGPPQSNNGGQTLPFFLPACCHCSQLSNTKEKGKLREVSVELLPVQIWCLFKQSKRSFSSSLMIQGLPPPDLSPCFLQDNIFQGQDNGCHKMGGL